MKAVFVGIFFPFYILKWIGNLVQFVDNDVVNEIAPEVGAAIKAEIKESLKKEKTGES